MPVVHALLTLSERRVLTPHQRAHALEAADDFVRRSNLGYVVIDASRVTPELRELAHAMFRLDKAGVSGHHELYVVRQ
jgi:hypothetical protein